MTLKITSSLSAEQTIVSNSREFSRTHLKSELGKYIIEQNQTHESPKIKKAGLLTSVGSLLECFMGIFKSKKDPEKIKLAANTKITRAKTNLENPPQPLTENNLIVQLDEANFEPFKELNTKVGDKETLSKLAQEAKLHKNVPPIKLAGANLLELVAWGWNKKTQTMVKGRVNPTSMVNNSKSQKSQHLVNCYTTVTDRRVLVRTGVINTQEKALDWFGVCIAEHERLVEKNPTLKDKPIRIVSHQLNSPENEGKLIDSQHRAMLSLNKVNTQGAQIAHLNTPLNRFYHFTKLVRKIWFIGRKLESLFLSGERKSHEQNIEGLGTYATWVTQDFSSFKATKREDELDKHFNAQFKGLQSYLKQVTEAIKIFVAKDIEHIHETKLKIATLDKQKTMVGRQIQILQGLEGNLVKQNETDLQDIKDAYETLGINFDAEAFEKEVMTLASQLVAKDRIVEKIQVMETKLSLISSIQSRISDKVFELAAEQDKKKQKTVEKELYRLRQELKTVLVEEHAVLGEIKTIIKDHHLENSSPELNDIYQKATLFHKLLGAQLELPNGKMNRGQEIMVIELLNDRLNVISAKNCKSGLDRTAIEKAIEQVIVSQSQANVNRNLLFEVAMNWNDLSRKVNKEINTEKRFRSFINWLNKAPVSEKESEVKAKLRLMCQMRNMILQNLLESGIPITARSTGVEGFKWHKEWYLQNLLPQNFLPPFAEVKQADGTTRLVPLLKYNFRTGRSTGLTVAGLQLVIRDSENRGT